MQKKAQTEKETRLQLKIEEQKKEISSLKKQLRKKDASRKSDAAMVKELKSELKNARRENEDIKKKKALEASCSDMLETILSLTR